MESSEDKHWASKYLLDPLTAPEPSAETGPGTNHNTSNPQKQPTSRFSDSTFTSNASHSSSQSHNKTGPSVTVRSSAALPGEKTGSSVNTTATSSARSSNNPYRSGSGYPTPPGSASPRNARFPDLVDRQSPQTTGVSTQIPTSTGGTKSSINHASPMPHFQGQRRRTSSLTQRHPGDQTHRPLDMLKREDHRANRSPHLRKKTHVGADSIDTLDNVGPTSAYHHEGPYDATLLARNMDPKHAPIAAVREGNAKALEATPRELVNDSVRRHRPLDGVAVVPPGMVGPNGEVMRYEEGSDMMIEGRPEGGEFRRWPGIKYLPDDLKGKGEPSFSIEKALKAHTHLLQNQDQDQQQQPYISSPPHNNNNFARSHRRNASESQTTAYGLATGAIEMTTPAETRRPMSVGGNSTHNNMRPASDGQKYADWEQRGNDVDGGPRAAGRSASGATDGAKLRKRFGSLRAK